MKQKTIFKTNVDFRLAINEKNNINLFFINIFYKYFHTFVIDIINFNNVY